MNRREFMARSTQTGLGLAAAATLGGSAPAARGGKAPPPNVVVILCDDMGYSDLGCYGGEIETPNLDRLAAKGLRFSQFYNAAKCSPTRTSLLTGLYPHQTNVGAGKNCVTIAEALREAGYRTMATGKWHVGGTPMDRGFDRYFGMLGGACSYFVPDKTFRLDREPWSTTDPGFYTTNAFTDYALEFLDEAAGIGKPFFLYLAYNAPHYPLHAMPEDIAKYRGKYMKGWDLLREERYRRQVEMGLIEKRWALSPRDGKDHRGGVKAVPPWDEVENKEEWDLKMAVYAAMVDRVDQNVGRLLKKLDEMGATENTLVMFLADNGACPYERNKDEDVPPGPRESYRSYDTPWANLSDTPFRLYKRFNHEGGHATPFIARWPAVIQNGGAITRQVGHIIDIMATCVDLAGAEYPSKFEGRQVLPKEGRSLRPIFEGDQREGHDALFWEFSGNRAVRQRQWKLVSEGPAPWELYNLETDRTELDNLADRMPEKVEQMAALYEAWAKRCGVGKKAEKDKPETKTRKRKDKSPKEET